MQTIILKSILSVKTNMKGGQDLLSENVSSWKG